MIHARTVVITILLIFVTVVISAQCPMCRIAAESNLENGGTAGKGLNTGILYMLAMPYLLVAVLGFVWYRNKKSDIIPGDHLTSPSGE